MTPSVHKPPFWQGLDAHSLMFVWHCAPMKPGWHWQVKKSLSTYGLT